jgi:small subunit ribosomal protein S16
MLKIRLMRIGTKGRPFYRIVVVDERKKRTGGYIDLIGTYNPLTNPKEIRIDQNKVEEWTKKGAQLSGGFLRITKQNTHIEPRKVRNPGKLRSNTPKEEPAVEEAPAVEETAQSEETEQVEAPAETVEEAATEEVTPTPEITEDVPVEGEAEAVAEESSEATEEEAKAEK